MSRIDTDNFKFINTFLESIKRTYMTGVFAFTSFTKPNTMFKISNDLPSIMLDMNGTELKVWLTLLSLLKRNHEPTVACTVYLTKDMCGLGKSSFYDATSRLMKRDLIIKTLKQSEYIVNPNYAHKLFKPKCEFELPDNL